MTADIKRKNGLYSSNFASNKKLQLLYTLLAIQTVPIFLIIIVTGTAVIIKDSTCIDFKSTIRYIHSSVMKVSSISCGLVCKDLLT